MIRRLIYLIYLILIMIDDIINEALKLENLKNI